MKKIILIAITIIIPLTICTMEQNKKFNTSITTSQKTKAKKKNKKKQQPTIQNTLSDETIALLLQSVTPVKKSLPAITFTHTVQLVKQFSSQNYIGIQIDCDQDTSLNFISGRKPSYKNQLSGLQVPTRIKIPLPNKHEDIELDLQDYIDTFFIDSDNEYYMQDLNNKNKIWPIRIIEIMESVTNETSEQSPCPTTNEK